MSDIGDFGDIASKNQATFIDDALAAHQARRASQQAFPSLELCEDCDDEIPKARQEAELGCTRCVACQRAFELRGLPE